MSEKIVPLGANQGRDIADLTDAELVWTLAAWQRNKITHPFIRVLDAEVDARGVYPHLREASSRMAREERRKRMKEAGKKPGRQSLTVKASPISERGSQVVSKEEFGAPTAGKLVLPKKARLVPEIKLKD